MKASRLLRIGRSNESGFCPNQNLLYCVPTMISTETAHKREGENDRKREKKTLTMFQPDGASIDANESSKKHLGTYTSSEPRAK
jgi:hypothetical protein